jgi:predicted transcriptional regulator
MARINVFLKDEVLKVVDREAAEAGMNRSALIQTALKEYLEAQRRVREEAEAQRRMDDACKKMDALARKLGDWDPVKVIREFRDSRYGARRRQNRHPRARKRQ